MLKLIYFILFTLEIIYSSLKKTYSILFFGQSTLISGNSADIVLTFENFAASILIQIDCGIE